MVSEFSYQQSAIRYLPKIRERQYAVSSRQQENSRQKAAKSKKERDDWKISKFKIANSNWLHPDLQSLVLGLRSFVTGQLVRAVSSNESGAEG